eukprot:gnl/TRDRNA2_/TRDRNA2_158203_c0_seq2.p1 gnl/TRDRNA2_/TRDRNA2_158203_c0~~gnl/TRDRNA2_/TRDRNA2_158203_c0_seq2.p1  ORF type:complete len:229 (+),score=65.81 gnl/TRDRNA2_/TRDRNA2_158203_c0_seq2:87-773(+)
MGSFTELMESAIAYVEAQGDNAIYVYLFFTFVGVVALVPTTPMEFAGGFLFSAKYGMWTTWLLTSFAKLCANVVSVWAARNVFKDWVNRTLVAKSELLTMVSLAVKEEPFKMAFLVRGSMVPLCVKNYGLGVLDIGYFPIACCSLIFTPFYAFQNIYLGASFSDLKEVFMPKKNTGEAAGWQDTIKGVLPIVFNVFLVLFLVKAVKGQMKKQKEKIAERLKEGDKKAQ